MNLDDVNDTLKSTGKITTLLHQVVQEEMDIIRLPMELIMVVMDITFGDGEHKNVLYQQFHMEESLEYLVVLVIAIKQ